LVVVDDTVLTTVLVDVSVTLIVDVVSFAALMCAVVVLPAHTVVTVTVFVLLARASRARLVGHGVGARVRVVDLVDTWVVVTVAMRMTVPTVLVDRMILPSMMVMTVVL